MKAFLVVALIALVTIITVPIAALADETPTPCGPLNVMKEVLADRYGETEFFVGIDSQGMDVHVFASPNGTWTVVLSPTGGDQGCAAASGHQWVGSAPPAQGTEG